MKEKLIVVCSDLLHCLVETIQKKKINLLVILVRIIVLSATQRLSKYNKAKIISKIEKRKEKNETRYVVNESW